MVKSLHDHLWTFVGSLIGLSILAYLAVPMHLPLLAGSFGASALLLFGLHDSPFARPRNVLLGQMLPAFIGVLCYHLWGLSWISLSFAGAFAIFVMRVTHTVHPPGGATALIAVLGKAGWLFVVMPIGAGALILIGVAYVINNMAPHRSYPLWTAKRAPSTSAAE
ncbi:HPP family protein [Sulfobacillus acidophilus TPY]|uniref:HPP family protein n=1 Tax=Sulfobacillus acidophilus (strain ATCC 700253 / DSM 10332 / NAL) TaxID=679936 RepID=G8TXB6_SULAD|nr:HPP family protein [Sulfobacillus acidophilus TPY]AEW06118.1 HPP family protein [Sulfobacillus acidophilus DSM 10332]